MYGVAEEKLDFAQKLVELGVSYGIDYKSINNN